MGDETLILSNDTTYFCEKCENVIEVYSTLGETLYCPCCGESVDKTDIFYGKVLTIKEG